MTPVRWRLRQLAGRVLGCGKKGLFIFVANVFIILRTLFYPLYVFQLLQNARTSSQFLIVVRNFPITHSSVSLGSSKKEEQSIAFSGWNL